MNGLSLLVRALPALPALLGARAMMAQRTAAPTPPPAISAIREADLRRDLALLGGDAMRGREAGTVDELRASVWLGEEMRKIGLVPMGDGGSWFQWWNMRRTRLSPASSVRIGGKPYALWSGVVPAVNNALDVSAPTVFAGDGRDTTVDVRGRVAVVTMAPPPPASIRTTTNTYEYNYAQAAITAASSAFGRRGAAAVVLVADSVGDGVFDPMAIVRARGTYDVPGGVPRFVRNPNAPRPVLAPVFLVRRAALGDLQSGGQPAELHLVTETFDYPSVNVIGAVRGSDLKLRDEYVVFSSHQDHDGVRYTVAGDSIWNGADDNGSTSVALLAIARAWVKQPARRSALFIFHGAEERGLLGSRYHAAHPVVPLSQIAALLNGDMIGRNHPDSAALLGSQPPHRVSSALVDVALAANRATGKFVVDTSWDRPSHAEGWYFRSDHVPYAEKKVPALFFSTMLHSDYHTPRDKPARINYPKLERMARWMYMTGWVVGNAAAKPGVDAGFELR